MTAPPSGAQVPLPGVWPYALVFWAVFVWVFLPEFRVVRRPPERAPTPQDAGSKRVIVIGQGAGSALAFTLAAVTPAVLPHRVLFFWIGLATMIAGSLLRRHCFRTLGQSFTGAVIVRPQQAVVERGAYRYVRHPSYTAGALIFTGIGLALGNWISLGVLVGTAAAVYGYRVRVEERALVATLGDGYRRYAARTKRFVPFVF